MKFKKILLLAAALIMLLAIIGLVTIVNINRMQDDKNRLDLSCPNCSVIFLNIDLLRADYMYLITGLDENATPNINKFFNHSIIFTEAMAPAGYTLPSNIAVLTGTDTFIIKHQLDSYLVNEGLGIIRPLSKLSNENKFKNYKTIASILDARGYYTVNVNFGEYTGNYSFMDADFDIYLDTTYWHGVNLSSHEIPFETSLVEFSKAHGKGEPIFFLLRSEILHGQPFVYPADRNITFFDDVFYRTSKKQHEIYFSRNQSGQILMNVKGSQDFSNLRWMNESTYARHRQLARYFYKQQLNLMDDLIGELLNFFEEQGITDNSVIVLYANHGTGLYDNLVFLHGTSYQTNVHVPILIRHPKINKQIRIDVPITSIDLVPTIYEMLNIPTGDDATGLSEVIQGGEYDRAYLFGVNQANSYVRFGDVKLLKFTFWPSKLFNLTRDPGENDDIAQQNPELVKQLEEILERHEIEMIAKAKKTDSESIPE